MSQLKFIPDCIIYHDPCNDGYLSMCIAKYYMDHKHPNKKVEYCPKSYYSNPPDIKNKSIILCDVTFPKNKMLYLRDNVKELLILDHHVTGIKNSVDISEENKIFNKDKCGASITWEYFYPNIESPLLVKFVEARDIWIENFKNRDEFNSWFSDIPKVYENYIKYFDNDLLLNMIKTKGIPYREKEVNLIQMICKSTQCSLKFCKIKGRYYFVAYINSSVLKSDIGNKILEYYPYSNFSAIFSINNRFNSTSFSLRSTNTQTDVSKVAYSLGGGGHRNASGVGIKYVTNNLPGKVYDNSGELYNKLENIYLEQISINKNCRYNIIYMNSNIYKKDLGIYLLQTKYSTVENNIQECIAIMNIKHKKNHDMYVHVAAIWDYDRKSTNFSIIFSNKLNDIDKNNLKIYFGCYNSNEVKCKGLQYYINKKYIIIE